MFFGFHEMPAAIDTKRFSHIISYFYVEQYKKARMQTITIELLNEQTLSLLKQLEKLNLLRLMPISQEPEAAKRSWSGVLSKETGEKMLEYTQKSRDEWERNT